MMKRSDVAWTLVGIMAVLLSGYLLYQEIRTISLAELTESLEAISYHNWLLAGLATLGAYVALAWYDRIAIAHLGKKISWWFITLCSFTTYALAHNIGASVFSGALVRYRAYRSKGLTPQEIGVLIVFCSLTFVLGTLLAGGTVLVLRPELLNRVIDAEPWLSIAVGSFLLCLVGLYVIGAWRHFAPLHVGKWRIDYPRLPIVGRQLVAAPLELACAAAIIYFALPAMHNPGYLVILGVFLASFSLALLSHAPGGLGVLEVTFLAALPELNTADVLAALIVFRAFYLLLPFALAILIVTVFEAAQWSGKRRSRSAATDQ
ncbi:lysylphosphatidylglycerol synthase domain-containing protein [Pseudomonas stutzeri]|uniref:lysylphosphatidylglycerol synthase transmembrane domain-containing protein n=1 Tax=Stutzerimonas stutzeri TaxID=316 RepID=UPI00210D77E8|nr:YbhN family protein [Stutzerimonas stutzeri]MCQ4314016.1 lysylphosphatidylglycerol synthase domain-containing protein [Stutzerimonas stutzeri]